MKTIATIIVLLCYCTLSAVAGEKLRIVTFNAEFLAAPGTKTTDVVRFHLDSQREKHCDGVAEIIKALKPDILNLCEVTNAETVDYMVKLLHAKGLTDYRGYHIESDDTATGHDVAVITRLKPDEIDGKVMRKFSSPEGDFTWREKYIGQDKQGNVGEIDNPVRRHALYYFTVGDHKLGFLGLHLKSNPSDEAANNQRSAEVKLCLRMIRDQIVAKGYTPIVLGDLNDYDPDVPDRDDTRNTKTKALASLKDYDPSKPGPELVNVAEQIEQQADRYTQIWDRNRNDKLDEGDVQTMLDHILLPKQLMPMVRSVKITRAHDPELSDHFPVVVDLELTN
jgi:exonuclease III